MQQQQIEMLERLVAEDCALASSASRASPQEAKMSKARLIKRREWLEREQVAQRQARLSSVAQVKVDTVRNWVNRQLMSRQPSPRKMFAAMFPQPPTS